jgi:hypothetical protein
MVDLAQLPIAQRQTLLLPKPRPRRSGGVLVFVEDAAEAVVSSYVEASYLVRVDDRRGQWVQRASVRDPLVWAVSVGELFELA